MATPAKADQPSIIVEIPVISRTLKQVDRVKKIKALAKAHPTMRQTDIAKVAGVSPAAVNQLLKRHNIKMQHVEEYKENRADLLAGIQDRLLQGITPEDVQKAGLRDKVVAFGILMDKERLENGLSTQNHAVIMASAVMEAEKMSKRPQDVVYGDNNAARNHPIIDTFE